MKFNEKLIELRKQQGLSQDELGNKINVSRQSISKWESGQANPEIENVKELSKVLNVSVEYLLNDESEKINKEKEVEDKAKLPKVKKIIFRIILVILTIYLLISAYKFVILLIYGIRANDILDYGKSGYDNYTIMTSFTYNDKLSNKSYETTEYKYYTDNIEMSVSYDENELYELNTPSSISYRNSKERRAYTLIYNPDIEKYVYTKCVYDQDDTVKELVNECIAYDIYTAIYNALHPKVKITIDKNYVYIKILLPASDGGGYNQVTIDKNTGFVNEIFSNTETSLSLERYDYIFDEVDDYMIEEKYLEDIEYVMEEELYE